jgi:tetratricopeptide (TPR) repeat protein
MNDEMEGPEVDRATPPPKERDAFASFALVAGLVSLALVGGTTVAVIILFFSAAPRIASPVPLPAGVPAPEPPGPSEEAIALAEAQKTVRELRRRIVDLEVEILKIKERVKATEPEAVERLADRILAGDRESMKGARAVLAQRGGAIGEILADRLIALREAKAELEARADFERKKAEEAVRALLEERHKSREYAEKIEKGRASGLYAMALKAQESGHLDLAETYYSRALDIDPTLAGALNGRGQVRLGRGEARGALDDFTMAASLQEEYAPFHFNRGRALMALERYDEAAVAFERVLALDPGNAEALAARDEARRKND